MNEPKKEMLHVLISYVRPALGWVLEQVGLKLALSLAVCPQVNEFTAPSCHCHVIDRSHTCLKEEPREAPHRAFSAC